MNELQNQLLSYMKPIYGVLVLYSDLIILLLAASLFSLVIGWMISRSGAKRKLASLNSDWDSRYLALEDAARTDAENLEEHLQTLGSESKNLQSTNKLLTDTLKKNDSNTQRARAEAIELNRQHAETQERLQRIIQQRDKEIAELGSRVSKTTAQIKPQGSTHIAPNVSGTSSRRPSPFNESELNHADTVAIDTLDTLDSTVQMTPADFARPTAVKTTRHLNSSDKGRKQKAASDAKRRESAEEELVESTIALDEEALAFAHAALPVSRGE